MEATLRVLHVSPSFFPADAYGGPIASGLGLCKALAARGVRVHVLTSDANGSSRLQVTGVVNVAQGMDVEYHRRIAGDVAPSLVPRLSMLARWSDVVHLTGVYSFPTIPTLLVARALRRPLVWSARGALQPWHGASKPAAKWLWMAVCRHLSPTVACVHATSAAEAVECRRLLPDASTAVVVNGVDVPAREVPWTHSSVLRLLFVGRLHPIKGLENLLLACKAIEEPLAGAWTLAVAGDGAGRYPHQLRALAENLGIAQRVSFLGRVTGDAKEECFAAADVVALPSYTENFGMVVAEALARSRPVIVSRYTPWREVESVGCGLWVDNTPEALAAALSRLSTMPLAEMGRRGREWMLRSFSWEQVGEQMERLYRELAGVGLRKAP